MNKMDDAQKQAFLNAMRMQENKDESSKGEDVTVSSTVSTDKVETVEDKKETSTERINDLLHRLYDELATLQSYRSDEYTKESWMNFYQAYAYALSVYEMPKPTEHELTEAMDKLTKAKNQLVSH